ncbi:MAG TPA: ComF family protein [Pontiellaceae bacterium]|nr:ComF family protein [Pontiellaceae bacterium]
MFSNHYRSMLDLLYPRNCTYCGVPDPDPMKYLCWDCLSDTPKVEPPFCAVCGDPVAGDIQHDYTCFACARETPAFDRARSSVRYEGAVGELLRALKYGNALWVVQDLAGLLSACVHAEYPDQPFDVVTAVPLHPPRLRERGFNQSAVLGAALARRLGLPFRGGLVRRVRPTVTQTGLTAPQRTANVCGAFRVGLFARPAGRRILLVDDVMTTGATVNACAKALKTGGAASVHVVTVARG